MTFTWFQLYCAQARRLKWLQFWNKPPRISMFEIKSSTAQSLIKDMLFLLSYLREVLQLKTWVVSTPGKSNVGCLRCLLVLNFRFASKSLVSKRSAPLLAKPNRVIVNFRQYFPLQCGVSCLRANKSGGRACLLRLALVVCHQTSTDQLLTASRKGKNGVVSRRKKTACGSEIIVWCRPWCGPALVW